MPSSSTTRPRSPDRAWGAVDLKIGGHLDTRGDNQVQYGMTLLAPIFNGYGWDWGAGFRTEDAMHLALAAKNREVPAL